MESDLPEATGPAPGGAETATRVWGDSLFVLVYWAFKVHWCQEGRKKREGSPGLALSRGEGRTGNKEQAAPADENTAWCVHSCRREDPRLPTPRLALRRPRVRPAAASPEAQAMKSPKAPLCGSSGGDCGAAGGGREKSLVEIVSEGPRAGQGQHCACLRKE